MSLVLVGLSHHHTPIDVRERLSCSETHLPQALASILSRPGVQEAVLVSTCNRMEIYAVAEADTAETVHHGLIQHLATFHRLPETAFTPYLYRKTHEEAVTHLLRVAGGLDSLVLGEAQILGQVRGALRIAQEAGTVSSVLNTLFQQAVNSSRRIQNETGLGRGAFSIGHAAVDLASHIFADLSHATVLLLGAGKMSELTARHLVHNGVRLIVVANRTHDKAVTMANRLGGKAIPYDTFPEELVQADIVISSTAAPHPIVRREMLQPMLRRRRGKPLFLIDIAVPRDIDNDVADLDNVFLYNIDDLQAVVAEEARSRQAEAGRAEQIVVEETAKFVAWHRSREAAPVITQLQDRLESIRQEDLAILRSKLGALSEREWQAIEAATRAMMKKVAREPILRLKQEMSEGRNGAGGGYDLLTATKEIFRLHSGTPFAPQNDDPEVAVTHVLDDEEKASPAGDAPHRTEVA